MRVGKVRKNPLLHRTEMRVEIGSGEAAATISRRHTKELLAGADGLQMVVERVNKPFGSTESEAIVRVYDDPITMKETEPPYLLIRDGDHIAGQIKGRRKQEKELKNRKKRFRGTKKPER